MRATLRIGLGLILLGGIAAGYMFASARWPATFVWPFYLALLSIVVAAGAVLAGAAGGWRVALGGVVGAVVSAVWASALVISDWPDFPAVIGRAMSALVVPETFLPRWWPIVPAFAFMAVAVAFSGRSDFTIAGREARGGELRSLPASPLHHASAAVAIGLAGTLFAGLTFFQKLVIVAPVFEELLKFGVALLLAGVLAVRGLPGRFALGLLSGLAFGVTEHFVTYSSEPDILYLSRVVFHASAAAASMSLYHVLVDSHRVETRWVATVFSTVVHAANNLFALVYGIALSVLGGMGFAPPIPPIGIALGCVLIGGSIIILREAERVRSAAESAIQLRTPSTNPAAAHDL